MPDTPLGPLIEMRGISKSFGAIQALNDVNFSIDPGEILGLVGDNSAGKSTLMKTSRIWKSPGPISSWCMSSS